MRTNGLLWLALLALLGAGCAKKDEPGGPVKSGGETKPEGRPAGQGQGEEDSFVDSSQMPGRVHIVEAKDTLLQLAERYYRDRTKWRRIYTANKNRLSDPNDLPVGMKLIIP